MPDLDRSLHEPRVSLISNGIFRLMRAFGEDTVATAVELPEDDKAAIRDIAEGLIRVWDGLNIKPGGEQ
jgi:hypothetical protein